MTALVWCPFPDEATARSVADTLLDEELIACANILPEMLSLFAWKGERSESRETGVMFKTDKALLAAVIARIEALHPYETPAVLGWHCDTASAGTIAWLGALGGR